MQSNANRFGRCPRRSNRAETTRFLTAGLFFRPLLVMSHLKNTAVVCAALLSLTPPAHPQAGGPSSKAESPDYPEILFVQAASVKGGKLSERFPSGSKIVRLEKATRSLANLTPNFFSAADPRISFDGSKVLFAGKKGAEANWQIWEMNTDGTRQRQVTYCPGNCLAPAYLPRDAIAFSGEVQEGGRRWAE